MNPVGIALLLRKHQIVLRLEFFLNLKNKVINCITLRTRCRFWGKYVFIHFKIFFTNNGFEQRSSIFRWLKLERLLALESFFVSKLKNQFIWNKQKQVSFNYAASVNIKYFLSVLPQFETSKRSLHAGHASVHMNSLWITCTRVEGHGCQSFWNSEVFLNHVLLNPPAFESWAKGHKYRRVATQLFI